MTKKGKKVRTRIDREKEKVEEGEERKRKEIASNLMA